MGLVARNVAILLGGAAVVLLGSVGGAFPIENEDAGQPMVVPPVDAASVTVLDRITVGSRTGDSAIEQLASVSTVSGEAIERRQATTPGDLLFGVPGVAVQTDSKRVASSINIRGLQDFGRVAVIVDGARQDFHRSDHGPQNFFFLDPDLVQQVEVIRGPVANTYGSGAIGGVVVFETKDADDFLKPEENWAISSTGRFESNGPGWTTSTTGAFRFNEAFDVIGNFVYRDYDDYDDGGGDTVPGTAFDVLSGMVKTTIRPTDNSELKLGWTGTHDTWTDNDDTFDFDLKQNTWTARYNIKDEDESWLDLHVNLSYNKANLDQLYLRDLQQYDSASGLPVIVPAGSETSYDLGTAGIDIWNTSRFDTGPLAHEVTYGGDWVQDDVDNESGAGGQEVYTPDGKRRVSGAYIQDKVTWEWLEVIGALRYDSYKLDSDLDEVSGHRLSPRITVGVSPFQHLDNQLAGLQIYGTYAEGYRSPSITETLISGMHPLGVTFPFLPNPDLKPETAKTWEVGLNYKADNLVYADDALRLKAAYFNNDIDDYISLNTELTPTFPPVPGQCPFLLGLPIPPYIPTCAQYQNYAKGKIHGFELEALYDAQWVFGGLSLTINDGYTVNYDGVREDLVTIRPAQVTGSLGFRMMENKLTVGGEVQYNSSANIETISGTYHVDDYTLVNLYASYQANENFRLDARIDNLFDVRYEDSLNAVTVTGGPLYEPGLTIKLGATLRFGGA